ncbi:MAG: LytTR family DNA-binding domain-containing protein [Rikenellaceae bacterium]
MKVVIIEDEIAALEQLKALLMSNNTVDIEIVETIDSVEESIEFFGSERSNDVELVFMDIHLSDGYAFSIFKHVEVAVPIIFTTAYDEYALKSFEVNCIDYILKPISNRDIERIFSKLKVVAQYGNAMISDKRSVETILVLDSWRTVPLNISDVAFFYKESSKVKAFNHNGKSYLTNMTLEKIEEQLIGDDFVRANRQFIVARSAIKDLESYEGSRAVVNLHVPTPEMVVISRTKVTNFKRWLKGEK